MSRTIHHSSPFRKYLINGEINPRFELHHWMMNNPKEWRKVHNKKRRAELAVALGKVMEDPDGDVVFPIDRKPHAYYW